MKIVKSLDLAVNYIYNISYMYAIKQSIANKIDFKLASAEEIGLEIGLRLRQQRLLRHWTQQELADRSGLDVGTIKNLETKGQCALLTLIRITMALDCVNELSNLFQLKIKSISEMEQTERLNKSLLRRRAR